MTELTFFLIIVSMAVGVFCAHWKRPERLSELAASIVVLAVFAAALFVTDSKEFVRSMLALQIAMNILYGVAGSRHLRMSLPRSKARFLYGFVGVFVFLLVQWDIVRLAGMF